MKPKSNKIKRIIILLAILLLVITGSNAEDARPSAERVITYNEFIAVIRSKLPEIKKNELKIALAANQIKSATAAENINLKGTMGYGAESTTESSYSITTQSSLSSDVSVTKNIIQSGTTVNAGMTLLYYPEYQSLTSSASNGLYRPALYFSIKQSVLKNAFGMADRLAKKDAYLSTEIARIQTSYDNKELMNYYRKSYFDWLLKMEKLKLVTESLDSALQLEGRVRDRYKSGLSDNAEVQNARSTVLAGRESVETVNQELSIYAEVYGIYFDKEKFSPDRDSFEKLYQEASSCNYSDIDFAKSSISDIYRLTKSLYQERYRVYNNSLLPQLNLVGEYRLVNQNESLGKAITSANNQEYYVGVEFNYPIGNSAGESKLEECRLEVEQINQEYLQSAESYRRTLIACRQESVALKKIITLKEEKLAALESQYRSELAKFSQARIDLDKVISTSQSLTANRIALWESREKLIEIYIDYLDLGEIE